jgi:hypothetical protein
VFLKNGTLAICVISLLALPVAVAQNGNGAMLMQLMSMDDDAGIVLGQPVAVIEKNVQTESLADGTKITTPSEIRKWRDSQGRFRKQGGEVEAGEEPAFRIARIIDPVNNTLTVLNFDSKVATVFHLPDQGPGHLHPWTGRDDEPILAREGVKVTVEKLPGREIAGVYAEGRRETRVRPPGTVNNDKVIVSVGERWVATDLKILMASSLNDPRGNLTREVTKLDRSEPDPSLFTIPSDFKVKDVPALQP